MRLQLHRLKKINSTKAERKISEILKKNHIKFKARWKVHEKEVDFLIGKVIIEIDGDVHERVDIERETILFNAGYVPIHFSTNEVYNNDAIEEKIINLIKLNHGKKFN